MAPELAHEVFPVFIQCKRLESLLNVLAQVPIRETKQSLGFVRECQLSGESKGTHSVENADASVRRLLTIRSGGRFTPYLIENVSESESARRLPGESCAVHGASCLSKASISVNIQVEYRCERS